MERRALPFRTRAGRGVGIRRVGVQRRRHAAGARYGPSLRLGRVDGLGRSVRDVYGAAQAIAALRPGKKLRNSVLLRPLHHNPAGLPLASPALALVRRPADLAADLAILQRTFGGHRCSFAS
eukprot:TRINITY_DN30658_c2_g1_i1.p3 TRINITY_DN30658_c2_g1~~TRINITY_DN30658_c2_g1_i1.p3  ORF type:complete len:122 (+),score=6.15 TRINITY_DN30658_c2_g1_i1:132-497(+)